MKTATAVATVLALALVGGAGGWAVWTNQQLSHQGPQGILKANGRLEVERLEIATKFPGKIKSISVEEGELVQAGAVVAQLETADLQAQLAGVQAMAQRAAQATARAQGETRVRQVQLRVAQMELDNTVELRKKALVSNAEVDRRTAQRDGEIAGVSVATAAIGEAQAARQEAEAGMQRLRIAIEDHTLRAPVEGRIEYLVAEPGSVIPSGGRVVTVLNTSTVHMTVFLPTSVAGRLKVGDEARMVLDAAPQYVIPAKVSYVAAEAQFTPKYVETSVERDKLMYRVKLKIAPELTTHFSDYVKAGLTGDGYVRVEPQAAWPANLAVKLPQH
jgi:HlyD family secretion protein